MSRQSPGWRPAASSISARVAPRRSISRLACSATTLDLVPPLTTPAFTDTPGQRPFSSVSASVLCAASTIALRPFSGSTPACAARPVTSSTKSAMPLRALTMLPLARAASRMNATSTFSAALRITGVLDGEPISSSGLATNVNSANGSQFCLFAERPQGVERVQAAQQAALHVVNAGPVGAAAAHRERTLRRRAVRKDRVHVADEQRLLLPFAPKDCDDGVPQLVMLHAAHVCAEAGQTLAHPRADAVNALFRVAPAIDVHEMLQVRHEGGRGVLDMGAQSLQLGVGDHAPDFTRAAANIVARCASSKFVSSTDPTSTCWSRLLGSR